jgi:serine/threonine protein kinase
VIYKKFGDEKRIALIVEVKAKDKGLHFGQHQAANYSANLLDLDNTRFLVLSMVCTLEKFAFFCTFRFNSSLAFIQLSEYDYFSFGSNCVGLLKLLYVLDLPWPAYGSMIVNDGGNLSVWRQGKFLGSGSSAEVYEYFDGEGNSKAVKFFKSDCWKEFYIEVGIYNLLKDCKISLRMEWYDCKRLIICTDGVREVIKIKLATPEAIEELYQSLENFHLLTNCVHRDIYYKNILQTDSGKLYLNDFGLAVRQGDEAPIKGNRFFASERVLLHSDKKTDFLYKCSDDIYSLTFSLIFLANYETFSVPFNDVSNDGIIRFRQMKINELNNNNINNALDAATRGLYKETKNFVLKVLF